MVNIKKFNDKNDYIRKKKKKKKVKEYEEIREKYD
jgi:hypothetical protein